jgi:hypothetical protein
MAKWSLGRPGLEQFRVLQKHGMDRRDPKQPTTCKWECDRLA